MQFQKEVSVSHPASKVLDTMMNRLEDLTPFRSRLSTLETVSRDVLSDGRVKLLRRCEAFIHSVPTLFRPFLSEGMLTWDEEAVWTPEEFSADWSITNSLGHLYTCSGRNYFAPHPNTENVTTIKIGGEINIDPEQVPGVPTFVARRLVPRAERVIISLIEPDLIEIATALQSYLDQNN